MTAVEVFERGDWSLRTVTVDGEPWFVAADVARALGYRDAHNMVRRLDQDERGTRWLSTPGGEQQVTVVTEAGLYVAILGSQVPRAKAFKRWVTHEVIPSIRKTGSYTVPERMPTHAEALRGWASEIERREAAEAKAEALEPSAAAYDQLVAEDGRDYPVREASGFLSRAGVETGQNRLFKQLRHLGWIDRRNIPYQRHIEAGRLVLRLEPYTDRRTGKTETRTQPRLTVKGIRDLHRLLGGTRPLALTTQLRLIEGSAS